MRASEHADKTTVRQGVPGDRDGLAGTILLRRAAVLRCLREVGRGSVSGQRIALELGISRAAVSNHIAALRGDGYIIKSAPRVGYTLVQAPDLPLAYEVLPLLRGRFTRVQGGGITGSTNDDAKQLAQDGASEGTVVLAAMQTAGRGRLGRTWQSPEGGLYASYVLRPQAEPARCPSLSLVVALGVADSLREAGVPGVVLKWPNDLLLFGAAAEVAAAGANADSDADDVAGTTADMAVGARITAGAGIAVSASVGTVAASGAELRAGVVEGTGDALGAAAGTGAGTAASAGTRELGKVCGILLEMASQMDGVEYVVPGIGINVNRPADIPTISDGTGHRAAYLSDVMDETPSLARLAALQIDSIAARYDAWLASGCSFVPFMDEYNASLATAGQDVAVSTIDGRCLAQGVALGVDGEGRLLVRDETGFVRNVSVGEVTLRR